jgi:hypothetical protein
MISVFLCLLSFTISFIASRRSLVAGLVVLFAIGYAYGITRANLLETFSHFIFDAGVAGLYLAQLTRRLAPVHRHGFRSLKLWVMFLMIWPALLFLLPIQDTMVEFVGLRGNIFLLPFLLIGARLENDDLYKLSLWIAGLNLLAFGFAVAEFILGVQPFFPKSEVTTIIYISNDLANAAYRIPASFTSAHAYASTMVMTIPLLVGTWVQNKMLNWQRYLLVGALAATIMAVFMAAARTHTIILFLLLIVITLSITFSGQLKLVSSIGWILMVIGVAWIVSSEERLQRFMTLQDTDYIAARISISVNKGFIDRAVEFPLGNGLGGGGTSLPYFLQGRVKNLVVMENEYGRIMLEQGVPGLCLWLAFVLWAFTRKRVTASDSWSLGRRLAWFACLSYFITGLIGIGLLTSIPQTCLILLFTGWIAVRQPISVDKPIPAPYRLSNERRVMAQ